MKINGWARREWAQKAQKMRSGENTMYRSRTLLKYV